MCGVGQAARAQIAIYSTCPQSKGVAGGEYPGRVTEVARWSEQAGCRGMFVYTDNGLLDPWVVAMHALSVTTTLRPLVAVQPLYMHPYTVAKLVASIAHLHGRAVDLNLVAGGSRNDLVALADGSPYEHRYERIVEYATIVTHLTTSAEPLTFGGRHYRVSDVRLTPPVPEALRPRLFVSGASQACLDAARTVGAVAVSPPRQAVDGEATGDGPERGVRVGIITRPEACQAWEAARARFPSPVNGGIDAALAERIAVTTDTRSGDGRNGDAEPNPYWRWPATAHGTHCPYLVGTHERVSVEIARYLARGVRTFIADTPLEPDDLLDVHRVVHTAAIGLRS